MKASDIFGIIIRTLGFAIILYSFWEIIGGVDNFLENLTAASADDIAPTFPYFLFGVPAFIAGAICFFLADWIVKLAYRE